MKRFALLALSVTFWLGLASAQTLVVNGVEVGGVRGSLVPGATYVEAEAFAQAIGALYRFGALRGVASFELGGHVLAFEVFDTAAEAGAAQTALLFDGRPLESPGGILTEGNVYVYAKPVVQAFGGVITYLEEDNTVMVVMPRASLREVVAPSASPGFERFVLELSAPVPVTQRLVSDPEAVVFEFDRTDPTRIQRFSGTFFRDAVVEAEGGRALFRLSLRPGATFEAYPLPGPRGFSFLVDVFPDTSSTETPTVVLDPGHGGADTGLELPEGTESMLTLAFAHRLADLLASAGVDVRLTRESSADVPLPLRSSLGTEADLFVSLHAANLPAGQFNLYFLGDAEDIVNLRATIRQNAEAEAASPTTDETRRRILLGLVPDLPLGESLARDLSRELSRSAGLSPALLAPAPLFVLGGAAGRGLLLEFSAEDLTSPELPEALSAAIRTLLATPR